jgi:tetraacyldisaccharide 4'-kinase
MSALKVLLFPFSVIYDLITRFRNHLYNINYKRSFDFEANIICVGNLSVGGTGKSPMIMYLINHFLKQKKKIATLSRGYGRKTKGFMIAGLSDTSQPDLGQPDLGQSDTSQSDTSQSDLGQSIGDEPAMFYRQLKDKIMVSVCVDRV